MQSILSSIATILIAAIVSYAGTFANETTDSKAVEAPQKVQMDNESEKNLKPQGGSEEKPGNAGKPIDQSRQGDRVGAKTTDSPAEVVAVSNHHVQNPPNQGGDIQSLIRQSAAAYGVPIDTARRIAHCESTTGANLVNEGYTAPDGSHPTGVYQFTQETWFDLARQRGWPIVDERLNHTKNIDMFAWAYANGNAWRWECK